MSKFVLLLGPSGVGKSTVIEELIRRDQRFVYISPYTTRMLRPGERNKISVTSQQMDAMWQQGKLLVVNELYGGIRYATPKMPIIEALATGYFPVLDWPVARLAIMQSAFPGQLYSVYIAPPTLTILQDRLSRDGRDADGRRYQEAEAELELYWSGKYAGSIDLEIVATENQVQEIAEAIHASYLKSF